MQRFPRGRRCRWGLRRVERVMSPYPTLLDFPAAALYGYSRETVVAEKLQALVQLRILNTRMKDYFDL